MSPSLRLASASSQVLAVVMMLALGTAAGCSLKQAAPIKQAYLVEAKRPSSSTAVAPTGQHPILRVRGLQVVTPFDGRGFVYRQGEFQYRSDYYHEFLASPRALFTEQVAQWLNNSGMFKLVDLSGRTEARYSLEGTVSALYGDFRESSAAKGVLAVQFVLTDEQPASAPALWTHRYQEEIPLTKPTPEGLAAGWSAALAKILSSLEKDLAKDLSGAP